MSIAEKSVHILQVADDLYFDPRPEAASKFSVRAVNAPATPYVHAS